FRTKTVASFLVIEARRPVKATRFPRNQSASGAMAVIYPLPESELLTFGYYTLAAAAFLASFSRKDAKRFRQWCISMPGPSTGCQRSPALASRFSRVRIVNFDGSKPRLTSAHLSGVETVAPG